MKLKSWVPARVALFRDDYGRRRAVEPERMEPLTPRRPGCPSVTAVIVPLFVAIESSITVPLVSSINQDDPEVAACAGVARANTSIAARTLPSFFTTDPLPRTRSLDMCRSALQTLAWSIGRVDASYAVARPAPSTL